MRVKARRWSTSRSAPSSTSATSTRVVLDPMSMQAQSIRSGRSCHHGRVTAIEVRDLHKSYEEHEAVRGIDFEVRRGEIFGLLGPNGAGKTTTVEILEGYRSRSAGHVSVLGHDPAARDPDLRARVGIVLQSSGIYQYLTVRESVAHWAGFYPAPRDVEEVIGIVGLADVGRAAREQALRRPEAPPRPRARAHRRPRARVPRRADHRLRPRRAAQRVGHHALAARPRQDRPADDALPRRGAGARGSRRDHQGRAHPRRGAAVRARRRLGALPRRLPDRPTGRARTRPTTRPRCCTS